MKILDPNHKKRKDPHLEVPVSRAERDGGRGEVVLVLPARLERVLPAGPLLQVVVGELLLRFPIAHVRLHVVVHLGK